LDVKQFYAACRIPAMLLTLLTQPLMIVSCIG